MDQPPNSAPQPSSDPLQNRALPLRHPSEVPFYVFMVTLNLVVIGALLRIALAPVAWQGWLGGGAAEDVAAMAAGILLWVVPGIVIVRQIQRASVAGTTVALSETQFPDLRSATADFAQRLGLSAPPQVYLANGNGALNAFAAQSGLHNNYVTISNELFANLERNNREGLRFIIGHETAHIRLGHVTLWYQLSICFSGLIPILGPTLSRLREYSCDRNGAALEPNGQKGLVLLAAGRYAHDHVELAELVEQGQQLGGFWVELAQLQRSHPFTIRRLWRLYQLGLFHSGTADAPPAGPATARQR